MIGNGTFLFRQKFFASKDFSPKMSKSFETDSITSSFGFFNFQGFGFDSVDEVFNPLERFNGWHYQSRIKS